MRILALLLAAAVVLATGGWFLLTPDPGSPESRSQPDLRRSADTERVPRSADAGIERAATPASSENEPRPQPETDPVEGSLRPDTAERTDPSAARHRVSNGYVTSRLGWTRDDARAAFVARWVTDKLVQDGEFFDELESAPDRDKPTIMRRFNEATEARRAELIASLGVPAGTTVVETWCTYRFDTDSLSWHRIDIDGQRVEFQHEDDDIWQNGELADRGWDNHR